ASERSDRATQTSERRLEQIQRRYDAAYRQQQDLARVERDLTIARQQGLISISRQNELMTLASGQQTRSAAVMQEARGAAENFAAQAGVLGLALSSVGKVGLVAAAALGVYTVAIETLGNEASRLADKAGKLVDFAQTTQLSTTALQALTKAGAEVGVESE